jgi:hypothetical protein
MNENTTGAPLTATVGEQLGEKAHQRAAGTEVAGGTQGTAEGAGTRGRRPERRVPGQPVERGGHSWVPLAAAAIAWVVAQNLARRLARRLVRGRKSLLRRWH